MSAVLPPPAAPPAAASLRTPPSPLDWAGLVGSLAGELHTGERMRQLYATDASAYQQLPAAVAIPRTERDLVTLVQFAGRHRLGLIPRAAGTSLAGQVVGEGIVVDVSRHFTGIVEIDAEARTVRVQPGVIRNELNAALAPHGMLFGPETSTQNRAMIGGMLGNNSCGSNSLKYGSVRDHVQSVRAILADGSMATFEPLTAEQVRAKCEGPDTLETTIYREVVAALTPPEVRDEIAREFPKPSIHRRNTGYAIDVLAAASCFDPASSHPFNLGQLIAGSEGTLCLVTEITLRCLPLPPPVMGLQCAQFASVDEALQATTRAVRYDPYACELIDHHILECTRRSREHQHNRFLLEGEPQAVLVTEIRGHLPEEVRETTDRLEAELREAGLGYTFPVLMGPETARVWDLRKAGLGLLGNVVGDEKAVPVIEDTAVDVDDLPAFIAEVDATLAQRFGLDCVHYAHAGSGELHLRPIVNLKTHEGHQLFRDVATAVADIVKAYGGSLSGEHGDGRLRGEFLERMIGPKNYALARRIKEIWDPENLFNPGKIIDTPPMNTHLRYRPDDYAAGGESPREVPTLFDWSATEGLLRAAEMCNGSGDCRKTPQAGGTMCPSYMATRREEDTTRARANMLRHVLTRPRTEPDVSPLADGDLKAVLDLCLSCKGCKGECPSTVDMGKMKAEFQQAWHDAHGVPLRSRLVANFARSQRWAARTPRLAGALTGSKLGRRLVGKAIGFHPDRSIPPVARQTLRKWFAARSPQHAAAPNGRVLLLADEFTNYLDVPVGQAAVELLEGLGYAVELAPVEDTARSALSKGLVRQAREQLEANVARLAPLVADGTTLVGLEPSALLTFRDETLDLCRDRTAAERVAEASLLLEEFLVREAAADRIGPEAFDEQSRPLLLHGHCFQKALVGLDPTIAALQLPPGARVQVIPSGCCGMAGSFGYEAEHYELSMQIGELVLLPAVRAAGEDVTIVAPGTSCRHQIHDGAARTALHPAQVLRSALRSR